MLQGKRRCLREKEREREFDSSIPRKCVVRNTRDEWKGEGGEGRGGGVPLRHRRRYRPQ